jgi:hypothetical protein
MSKVIIKYSIFKITKIGIQNIIIQKLTNISLVHLEKEVLLLQYQQFVLYIYLQVRVYLY